MSPDPLPPALPTMRALHTPLAGGLAAISVVFLLLTFGLHTAPLLPAGPSTTIIAYLLAGIGLAALAAGLFVFKSRVPRPHPGQSLDDYWAGEARGHVLLFWVVILGGGVNGAVGFLLTGSLIPALATVGSLIVLLSHGAGYFEDA